MLRSYTVALRILGIGIAVALVVGAFSVGRELLSTNWTAAFSRSLIPAAGLHGLAVLLFITQWTLVTRWMGFRAPFRTMAGVYCAGTVVESITPSMKAGGEATKVLLLHKRFGIQHGTATAVVLVQKFLSAVVFLVLVAGSLIAFILSSGSLHLGPAPKLLLALVIGGGVAVGVMLYRLRSWTPEPIDPRFGVWARFRAFMVQVAAGLRSCRLTPLRCLMHMVISLVIWSIYPLSLGLLLSGLGVEVNWFLLTPITFISYLVGMLPLLPGGIGSFDAAMVLLLQQTGVELSTAISLTLAFRLASFWLVLALSGLYLAATWFMRQVTPRIRSHIPNIITLGNLLLGTSGVLLCLKGMDCRIGAALILGAAVLDSIDGWSARRLNAESALGKELDSLADLVSFGIAPMVILLSSRSSASLVPLMLPFTLCFVAASAFRLARYNVSAPSPGFLGLPITAAGLALALMILLFPVRPLWIDLGAVALLSAAMVSRVPVPRLPLGSATATLTVASSSEPLHPNEQTLVVDRRRHA